ncbi:MAG TPA: hypothetical protein VF698_11500 [Thermoanaerobaculia bacterium]
MNRVAAFLILTAISLPSLAWTRTSDERIAKKGAALAPADLKAILEKFEPEYKRGLERAQADEGSDSHHYFVLSRSGKLRQRIESETHGTIAAIRGGKPMNEVAERLGMLAHWVADANNPFHVSNEDASLGASHDDYERYFERRMTKFPTVFYGLDRAFTVSAMLDRTFARSAKFYPLLREEYFRSGARRNSQEFDDRSTAFGIASVSYSRAVSDLVNLYYFIWREAGGDVRSATAMRGSNLLLNESTN